MKWYASRWSPLIAAVIGALWGYGLSVWERRAAVSHYRLRPQLAEVGYIDAMFANHGTDWLWYNHPTAMTIVAVTIMAVACGVGWYMAVRM